MQTTSRNAALDYLLAIWNLIALADHKEEQIMTLMEEESTIIETEKDPLMQQALGEQIRQEIVQAAKERNELYELRKDLQRNFFERYKIDNDYRCQFKHYAVALTAAEECRNADPTFQNDVVVTSLRKLVYQFLWTAMWVWPANCWRCLADAWDNKDTPQLPQLPEKYWWPFRVYHDGKWYVRQYKVVKKSDVNFDTTTMVEDLNYWFCVICKDVPPERDQTTPINQCTPIDADILEPTPIEFGWTQSDDKD